MIGENAEEQAICILTQKGSEDSIISSTFLEETEE